MPDDLNALEWRRSSGSGMCGERRTGQSCMYKRFPQRRGAAGINVRAKRASKLRTQGRNRCGHGLILCQDHRRNNDIGNACKVIADRPPRFPQHALSIHASEFRDRRNWLELKSKEPAINVPKARQDSLATVQRVDLSRIVRCALAWRLTTLAILDLAVSDRVGFEDAGCFRGFTHSFESIPRRSRMARPIRSSSMPLSNRAAIGRSSASSRSM